MRGAYRLKQVLEGLKLRRARRQAMTRIAKFPSVKSKVNHGLPKPLIVTLTSYPPRFSHLAKTLKSLLDQRITADQTILWLAESDVSALPKDVLALKSKGLQIRATHDIRSYKKLIPALSAFPDSFFVTADDDVFYPPDWLEQLVASSKENPNAVVGCRAHLAPITAEGRFSSYSTWQFATHLLASPAPDVRLFPTGVGGILYPPGAFDDRVHDEASFTELAPFGDDIWFFWMCRLKGTPQVRAQMDFRIIDWPDSQEVALYNNNLHGNGNDKQLLAMYEHFGPVP